MIQFLENKYFFAPMVALIAIEKDNVTIYSADGSFSQETGCYIMPHGAREVTEEYFEKMVEGWNRLYRHKESPQKLEELVGNYKGG
jgi:hypothetical protein